MKKKWVIITGGLLIIILLIGLSVLFILPKYWSNDDKYLDEDENEPYKPPLFTFNYTVEVKVLNNSSQDIPFYLIVPFPVQRGSLIPEPIKENLEIYRGEGSFYINNSIDKNDTEYDLGLQINTSGDIVIGAVGKAAYAYHRDMSLMLTDISSHFHDYLIYSSYQGNLSINICCFSDGENNEMESHINGNVSNGWNSINGTQSELCILGILN